MGSMLRKTNSSTLCRQALPGPWPWLATWSSKWRDLRSCNSSIEAQQSVQPLLVPGALNVDKMIEDVDSEEEAA